LFYIFYFKIYFLNITPEMSYIVARCRPTKKKRISTIIRRKPQKFKWNFFFKLI